MALPQPTRVGRGAESYLHFPSLLSAKDLSVVLDHVNGGEVQGAIEEGILFTDVGANRDRNSKVSWLERPSTADEDDPTVPEWLHTRLRKAAAATHTRYGDKLCPVGIDKLGRWTPKYEPIQYTEYPAGSHYGAWHTDGDVDEVDPEDTRSVTIVVLLASPGEDFEGGHFEVEIKGKKSRVKLQAGDAIGFPAKRLYHRVTKITSGLRRSMVFWVSRPGKDLPARYGAEAEAAAAADKAKAKAKAKAKSAKTKQKAMQPAAQEGTVKRQRR